MACEMESLKTKKNTIYYYKMFHKTSWKKLVSFFIYTTVEMKREG